MSSKLYSTTRSTLQWLYDTILDFLQRMLLAALASGPIPNHIAFVMDGNRRYAGRQGKPISEGHYAGFSALSRVLEACLRLGVRSVTVYAFAIDNFRRSPVEVDALMTLCEEKLYELCKQGELLELHGVRLRVLGKTSLLPQKVRKAIKKVEDFTRHHNKAVLNVMMPYSSREEMTTAIRTVVRRTLHEKTNPDLITDADIEKELYTSSKGVRPVEVLVRTSGVKRLSDFLTWQCSENVQVHFAPVCWPDFSLRHFIPVILEYQRKVWSRRHFLPQ